tara:strand:+ start:475 stop:708 length:234 start_codon:yes stop_codon:yes gene_type:complete
MLNKIKVWWRGKILTDEDLSYSVATQTARSKAEARALAYEQSAKYKLIKFYNKILFHNNHQWFKVSVIILLIIIVLK